ncbi:hypothetical protein NQ314_008555 [Rhamnusium bicolor]|uniref:Small ribosomal subunit protein uS5m n=1 Tax=Rhamnusium bicolor TaxID=1586634 RepID=A0AAV8Y8M9_9CUCU|nr:hypothetical protein NQ314_008555 [Rhamnusium bicolor]
MATLLNVTKTFQKLTINSRCKLSATLIKILDEDIPRNNVLIYNASRNTNFLTNVNFQLPAQDLWKGITSVSNAGRKRGRGKTVSKSKIKDLNRGQIIGIGKANMVWPGLSAPIIRGKELVEQQKLPEDPEREKKLNQLRDQMGTFKHTKLSPIERGWSGTKMPGRSIGPPDPVGEDNFEGFDTKVLELKAVVNMKGNLGRKRQMSALAVTGNKNGLAGFAMGKAVESRTALRKAKNRAGQKLMYIKLFRNHTVCHRAIKTICEIIGIKDLHAKVEGSTNVSHIMKAFFLGLIRQKTPEEMAEEKKLHLVEICKEK